VSIPNLIALAAFFAPRRIAKFFGFCGGKRRVRQEPHVWLLVAATGVVVASTVALLAFLHLTAFKEVPR
jgi:hypothetical protein